MYETLYARSRSHPCFNGCGGKFARLHLPVAPDCNIQCNYCVRNYDCPNESRPGVCTAVLSPEEALERFREVKREVRNLTVIGIAGPGDALADFERTRRTFALIRGEDPDITFCLSTNGLLLPRYVRKLAEAGLSHLTVTVNAVDVDIGRRIYRRIELDGRRYTGAEAAALLLENQLEGIRLASEAGVVCKVNCVMLKGLNDAHIPALVVRVKEAGASLVNIMQLIPVRGSAFEGMPLVSNQEITAMRKRCEAVLPQMYHCRQCRADAVGPLHEDVSYLYTVPAKGAEAGEPEKAHTEAAAEDGGTLLFAVASKAGVLVDQHFGHAEEFFIYDFHDGEVRFRERRKVPKFCRGACGHLEHENKLLSLTGTIADCAGVIALRIGEVPRALLEEKGIRVFMTYDRIEDAVRDATRQVSANLAWRCFTQSPIAGD
ncbi:MAG: nitrogenase cofactor biosynthesis protein NifB [Spirochaetaceae bacterium]|jgi:nitrogenase cofactor biosynthesis protein NifB|nr:nitrogenase cofactor biosynthesis protein NifB [Spirochaetaceae bacterium]